MAIQTWAIGANAPWQSAFATGDLTSLANASSVLSSLADIANNTALDCYAAISFNLASLTTAAPNKLDFFIYNLNQDGTTYGDNQLSAGTGAAKTPSATLWAGTFIMPVGTSAMDGTILNIPIPPLAFRWTLQNNAGVTFSASTNTIKFFTYNQKIV